MRSDHEQKLESPHSQREAARVIVPTVLLTALAMVAVELTNETALRIVGFVVLLLVAPAIAFLYGLRPGLASSALVSLYAAYHFSSPGQLFRYTGDDLRSLITLITLSIIPTIMVGVLRHAVHAGERQLRRQLDFANAVMGSLGEGVYAVDAQGLLTFMNPAAEEMLGWTEAELLGKNMHDSIHCQRADGTPFPLEECPLLEVLKSGRTCQAEDVLTTRDGQIFPVAYTSSPIITDGGLMGAVVVFRDITERQQAEEQREELLAQVEHALDLRNQFLSIASHELKTPITLLKGYAHILRGQLEKTVDVNKLKPLRVIDRQVGRMARLVDELLDASRIESGKIRFEMAPFALNEALDEVISEVRVSAPDFVVRVDEAARNLWVVGDRERIQQVMTNLLTNAIKYSAKRKEVGVCIRRDDNNAVVSIGDYGIGIPEEQQSEVFELYFRATNASVNNYGGLGMGLYISKHIIDHHGGAIGLRSEQGEGSTFTFSLPTTPPPPPTESSAQPT